MLKPLIVCIFVCVTLNACTTVGPVYNKPTLELETRYTNGGKIELVDAQSEQWWLGLRDKKLNSLVENGNEQNIDIRTAIERINEARAAVVATSPITQFSGGVSGSVIRSRTTAFGVDNSVMTTRTAAAGASFIFDIFGGKRSANEQAKARLESVEYDVGTTRLAFQSEIVSNYVNMRFFQEAIALTRRAITSRRETLEITQQQQAAGSRTALDTANAEALLNQAIASLPELENGFYSSVYSISTLINEPASTLIQKLQRGSPQPNPKYNGKIGVPADLLRNRPDIRSAERKLSAATADIGIAMADLYPSIKLDGNISVNSATSWSFGPTIDFPIFNQTALRANLNQKKSYAKQAELAWRKSVITAVNEVQSAQDSLIRLRREVNSRRNAAISYKKVLKLSKETFEAGSTSLLDLLEAERLNTTAQLQLASSKQQMAIAWVRVQVSAGKGWQ